MHPLSTGGDDQEARDRYADRVAVVLAQVVRIVRDVHAAGWVHGDVHPANLLVSDDDVVTLVDLELARPLTSTHRAGLGCPGFVRPGRAGRPLTRDDDEYALAALALWFFHPSTQVLDRDPQEAGALVRWIAERFPVGRSGSPSSERPSATTSTPFHGAAPRSRGRGSWRGSSARPRPTATTGCSPATCCSSLRTA